MSDSTIKPTGSWRITPVDIIVIGIILYRPFAHHFIAAILWLVALVYFAIKVYNSQDLNKKQRVVSALAIVAPIIGFLTAWAFCPWSSQ